MNLLSPTLLRNRDIKAAPVSTSELLFDLIYVFAVTQLSHFLLHNLSWMGFLQETVLWFAVWLVWQHTVWVTNWFDPDKRSIRLMLFCLMIVGLVMTSAIPEAYTERGVIFALAYVAMLLGRPIFVLCILGKHPLRRNYHRILAWALASALFWILGALREAEWRLIWWAVAVACDYFPPLFRFRFPFLGHSDPSEEWTVDGHHLAERCQLFVIIAFGETILMSGASLSALETWAPTTIAAALISFSGSLAMWWVYFDVSSEAGSRKIHKSDNPGWLGLKYHAVHVLLVGALIVCAVGDELVVNEPGARVQAEGIFTIMGGPALYLAANMIYKKIISSRFPKSHCLGIIMLSALAALSGHMSMLTANALTCLVFFLVILWDFLASKNGPPEPPA